MVEPSVPGENYSLLIIGDSNGDEDGGGFDGDGSGGNSLSWQGAGKRLLSPEIGL
jgi:hypothetical protein